MDEQANIPALLLVVQKNDTVQRFKHLYGMGVAYYFIVGKRQSF